MTLHPLAQQFASVAGAYEHGRPDYPTGVVDALMSELGLGPGAPVLDLGAGTGKLSRALLGAGLDVIAVEPLEPLREVLVEKLGADRVRAGLAEEIPLGDGAVEAVTVADAFHWFDHARALPEMRRVLRPPAGLAILITVPDWSGASWAHELGKLVAGSRPAHPHFDGPAWQDIIRDAGGWTEPRTVTVTESLPADSDRIVDHLASMSWIAGMPEAERVATIERMRTLVAGGVTPGEMPMHFLIGVAYAS